MEHRPDTDAECDDAAPDDVKRSSLIGLADPAHLRLKFTHASRKRGSKCSAGEADRRILGASHIVSL